MNKRLLAPLQIGKIELANRVVLAPLTRGRAGSERIPNAEMVDYYRQRASAGLIISEATAISPAALGWEQSPGIYTEDMIQGWRTVVDSVHAAGGRIFLQLWFIGRASHSHFLAGSPPVGPSPIAIQGEGVSTSAGKLPHETPRALTVGEIHEITQQYRLATKNAVSAGFDGVEVHAANGYLLDQFLQSKTNIREDAYGGSIENRHRFLDEVVTAISKEISADGIGVRLAPNGVFNDMGSADYREQFTYTAQQLNRFGLAYLHVVDGLAFGFHQLGEPMTLADFRNVFSGPLMGNCGYTQETAEQSIASGQADMIAFGRPYISNPDLVERFATDAPLNADAPLSDWYSPTGAEGYTDFPALNAAG